MPRRHLIIGGGTAGMNAMRTIREEERERSEITLVSAEKPYARMVLLFWVQAPAVGAWQATALAVAWVHACIGIHFWLRFRPWYSRAGLALFTAALLLPVLALLGFTTAGREVAALARQPGWAETVAEATRAPGPAERAPVCQSYQSPAGR